MEELRRERARILAETGCRSVTGPRPYHRMKAIGSSRA